MYLRLYSYRNASPPGSEALKLVIFSDHVISKSEHQKERWGKMCPLVRLFLLNHRPIDNGNDGGDDDGHD